MACSYDLRGNLIEVNERLERVLGYSRDEILGANLRDLIDADSWESTSQGIVGQAGGGISDARRIHMRCKSGAWTTLEVATRLVFENGHPVAVQAFGRHLNPIGPQPVATTKSKASAPKNEIKGFTSDLRQLHRLNTANYDSLEDAFADHLKTGCEILALNFGAILAGGNESGVVKAMHSNSDLLRSDPRIQLTFADSSALTGRLGTKVFARELPSESLYREFHVGIATTVMAGSEPYGTLIFSGIDREKQRNFTSRERGIIELLANGLGRLIVESQLRDERKSVEVLLRSRDGVLERVAENRPIQGTMSELAQLVEYQSPPYRCVFLLYEEGVWSCLAAPGLPTALVAEIEGSFARSWPGRRFHWTPLCSTQAPSSLIRTWTGFVRRCVRRYPAADNFLVRCC